MGEQPDQQVMTRPNRLKAKVAGLSATEPLSMDPALLAEANAALAEMEDQYEEWLAQDIATVAAALGSATADPRTRAEGLGAIADTAHNIKGQGATFGYDLVTEIAAALHDFACDPAHVEDVHVAIMRAHLDALRAIQAQKLKGDGGAVGTALRAALREAVVKHTLSKDDGRAGDRA